ncbi:MAG: hypothetical protein QOK28_2737 [Actinomycetota bacterium]
MTRPCDLCEAARMTPWHHEDDICWIADCEVCDVPMVVWRQHGTDPPADHLEHMLRELTRVADGLYEEWSIDRNMRQIPEHFHAHARDKDWYVRRFRR